jgi:hypothetical protein
VCFVVSVFPDRLPLDRLKCPPFKGFLWKFHYDRKFDLFIVRFSMIEKLMTEKHIAIICE